MYIVGRPSDKPLQIYKAVIGLVNGGFKEIEDVVECIVDERIYMFKTTDGNIYTIPLTTISEVNFMP